MDLRDLETAASRLSWFYIDVDFYLSQCVRKGLAVESDDGEVVRQHYLEHHSQFALSPNPFFDEEYYRHVYTDVSAQIRAGGFVSAFDHYVREGNGASFSPAWFFDASWYQRTYTDLTSEALKFSGHIDPFNHYLSDGISEGRSGCWITAVATKLNEVDAGPKTKTELAEHLDEAKLLTAWLGLAFDLHWFSTKYPDQGGISRGIRTYFMHARHTGMSPGPAFNEPYYREANPDVAEGVLQGTYLSGYHHYLTFGMYEAHRRPFPTFDAAFYAEHNAGVRLECQQLNLPLYLHYLKFRRKRTLYTFPNFSSLDIPESHGKGIFERRARVMALLPRQITQPQDDPEVSVIIITRDNYELLCQALQSIPAACSRSVEIIVYDNASVDEVRSIPDHFPDIVYLRSEHNKGFTIPVNEAAQKARGTYLVLVNNDIEMAPGAIDRAVQMLKAEPSVGIVGGRIIRAHGLLQEAGSVVWQDGSCLGYGRDHDPGIGTANFIADVDFCSGCFLAISREDWSNLNGFDEAFAPAYYEESDLCLRMWESGKRVVYDPGVTVWHYEFGSSRLQEDAIVLMQRNQRIFVNKHRKYLAECLPADSRHVGIARLRRTEHPRVLFIEDQLPDPTIGMGFVRSAAVCRALETVAKHLTLVGLHPPKSAIRGSWQPRTEVLPELTHLTLPGFLTDRRGFYDVLWLSRTHNLRYLRDWTRSQSGLFSGVRVILDTEAIASARAFHQGRLLNKTVDLGKLLAEELDGLEFVDIAYAVNDLDRALVEREVGRRGCFTRVDLLGHAVDVVQSSIGFPQRSGLVLSGSFADHNGPNADAIRWFDRKVRPKLPTALRDEQITIAGFGADHFVTCAKLESNYTVRSDLVSMSEVYDQSRLVLAPTRFAGGIPFKVHEAAASGVPTVMSRLLAEQLGWLDDNRLAIPEDESPEAYAATVEEFYFNKSRWERCAATQKKRIASECSQEAFLAAVTRAVQR